VGGARLGLDAPVEPVDAPSKEFPNEAHFSRYQIPISALDSRLPPSNGFCAAADEGSQVRPVGGRTDCRIEAKCLYPQEDPQTV